MDTRTVSFAVATTPSPTNEMQIQRHKTSSGMKHRFLPQETGDLKVYWARFTLISIAIVASICAMLEIWVLLNQKALKDLLLSQVKSEDDWEDIWFNFKVEMTYESVFLAACAYWVFIVWDSIMNLNTMEVLSINFYNIGLMIYSITQIIQISHDRTVFANDLENLAAGRNNGSFLIAQIALPIVIGLYIPLFLYCTLKLIKDFGWRQYRITGGDIKLQKVFFAYDILLLLIKYSLFFISGFTLINLVLTQVTPNGILIIPIVGSLVGFAIALAGYYGVRYELKWLAILYLFGTLAAIGYLVNRLYEAYQRSGNAIGRIEVPFLLYAATSGLLLVASFVSGVVCMMNFGLGLKETLNKEALRKRGDYTPSANDLDA